jgi:hypothetical protein
MGGKELIPGKNKVRMEFRGIDIAQHVLVTAIATLEFPSRNCRSQAWKNTLRYNKPANTFSED